MKTKITKVVALFTTLAIIFSCTEDMEYRDTAVSPVNQLYEPISGKSVERSICYRFPILRMGSSES